MKGVVFYKSIMWQQGGRITGRPQSLQYVHLHSRLTHGQLETLYAVCFFVLTTSH